MRRVGDIAEIGLMILIEGRGHADDNRVHLLDVRVIGGCRKALSLRRLDFFRADPVDVRPPFREGIDLALINVETGDGKFLFREQQSQRQSYVPQADNSNACLALLDLVFG